MAKWADMKAHGYDQLSPFFGIGYGADMNGFGSQGGPRTPSVANPAVTYPFQSPVFPGVTVHKQVSGQRTFDINTDGVAHYGLYTDWAQDLKILGGQALMDDMLNGAEAYLQMWERTLATNVGGPGGGGNDTGPKSSGCRNWPGKIKAGGIGSMLRLGSDASQALARAGEPESRAKAWRWCGLDRKRPPRKSKKGKRPKSKATVQRPVVGVFDSNERIVLALSALRNHTARGIGPGSTVRSLRARKAKRLSGRIWTSNAGNGQRFVYVVKGKRVRYAGVAASSVASPAALRATVAQAGLP